MADKFTKYQIHASSRAAQIVEMYEENFGYGGSIEEKLATIFSDLMLYTDMIGVEGKIVSGEAERYFKNGKDQS